MTPLLEVAGISAGYGAVQVLWDVSFALPKPGLYCLIGSNGAGKTTLMRVLSGLLPLRAGAIRFAGRSLVGLPPDAVLDVGLAQVPEGRRLFPAMSVEDNLLMGAYRRRTHARRGIERAYALFPRLKERRRQDASTLSGGEQQMCAIARGLMSEPTLLLIDELSLGLAPRVVAELAATLRTVADGGTSLFVVEQDVAAALELATAGFVMDRGRIAFEGPSACLMRDPRVRSAYLGL